MPDVVLFVFEGERTEKKISSNLKRNFSEVNSIIHAFFGSDIYQLFKAIQNDEYLDIVELIRDRNAKNKKQLQGISRSDVSQVFLFFDYDGHATNASDQAIGQMLSVFDNETESGKLYISYPMVEALRHFEQNNAFKDIVVNAKDKIDYDGRKVHYKEFIDLVSICGSLGKLTLDDWRYITSENYKKAHHLVNNIWELPSYSEARKLDQSVIFDQQLNKFISPTNQVAVLSAFPFFIIEYFGESVFDTLTENTGF